MVDFSLAEEVTNTSRGFVLMFIGFQQQTCLDTSLPVIINGVFRFVYIYGTILLLKKCKRKHMPHHISLSCCLTSAVMIFQESDWKPGDSLHDVPLVSWKTSQNACRVKLGLILIILLSISWA